MNDFRAPRWLPGGHVQTIWPALFSRRVDGARPVFERERWATPDGDFILDAIDGIVVCGGDSGHAFKFGPLLGRLCADLAQGRQLPPECDRFRVSRFAGAAA